MRAGRVVRALLLVALVALVVPVSSVQPATLSLSRVGHAKSVDFGDGVVWVLVLGSDARGETPVTRGRTDAIELLGFHAASGSAAGIGIPRDSYVDLPGVGLARINEALAEGGAPLAARAVEQLVGIAPDYVLVTGFDGFLSMAEVVGEVDVESAQRFVTDDQQLTVRRGSNRFDPEQALEFARSRDNLPGDDFARAANHQALLLGFLRRLREREDEQGFMERVTLAAVGGLGTDLPPTDLYRLAQAVTQVDPSRVTGCIVPGDPRTVFGASVVFPDRAAAQRLGADAEQDATLDRDCPE